MVDGQRIMPVIRRGRGVRISAGQLQAQMRACVRAVVVRAVVERGDGVGE